MFGIGDNTEVRISVEPGPVVLGGKICGIVHVTTGREISVRRAVAYLRCDEEAEYRVRRRSNNRTYTTTDRETCHVVDEESELSREIPLPPGMPLDLPFGLDIPQDAPPTYQGDALRVTWRLGARLDVGWALDPHEEVELTVHLPPNGPYAQVQGDHSNEPNDLCDLEVKLDGSAFATGSTVKGRLRIAPKQDFDAQEVRLRLVRTEYVPGKAGNKHDSEEGTCRVASETGFSLGSPVELPFGVAIPEVVCPSASTPHAIAFWWLDFTVARSWSTDVRYHQVINVYSMPR